MCLCTTINIVSLKTPPWVRSAVPRSRSVGEQRFEERPQTSVSDRQDNRRQGNEDNVGKASDDQQELGRGALVVVEVVDRDDAGSPGYNEEHDESKNHLGEERSLTCQRLVKRDGRTC